MSHWIKELKFFFFFLCVYCSRQSNRNNMLPLITSVSKVIRLRSMWALTWHGHVFRIWVLGSGGHGLHRSSGLIACLWGARDGPKARHSGQGTKWNNGVIILYFCALPRGLQRRFSQVFSIHILTKGEKRVKRGKVIITWQTQEMSTTFVCQLRLTIISTGGPTITSLGLGSFVPMYEPIVSQDQGEYCPG